MLCSSLLVEEGAEHSNLCFTFERILLHGPDYWTLRKFSDLEVPCILVKISFPFSASPTSPKWLLPLAYSVQPR